MNNYRMDGILIVDKPAGFTSHDVVARVRRLFQERRVGHTGTLDPFATGVLVVLVGRATRLAQFLSGAEKVYEAVIRFGYATETGDLTGAVRPETRSQISSREFTSDWDAEKIEQALSSLRGEIEQVPPMYSAKKLKGKKLYELARAGEEVERKAVRVKVHEFKAVMTDSSFFKHEEDGTCMMPVRVRCSAGTYIRTLAESLGERLGVAAHLAKLRRTRAGEFSIEQALTLDELERLLHEGRARESLLLPMQAALSHLSSILLTEGAARAARHGALVRAAEAYKEGQLVALCDGEGELIAVAAYDEGEQALRPRVVLAAEN
ncbi:MAG: tRNA pseudouridine(55) synthase TruB [Acidobacteria bacterium]|nr:tRNA pseudouridine(55) synthase TruB [Acidobacteriota bacterium]